MQISALGAATGIAQAEAVSEVPVVSAVDAVSVVVPPKADPEIMTLRKEAMKAVLKDKLAAGKS